MLMLAISKSIEGTRSIPATSEIFCRTSGDFQASYVKGARLGQLVNIDRSCHDANCWLHLRWTHAAHHVLVKGGAVLALCKYLLIEYLCPHLSDGLLGEERERLCSRVR